MGLIVVVSLLMIAAARSAALLPVVLVDNGSRRAESALALRESAEALSARLGGREVHAASLAYSDAVPPSALGGTRAQTLNQTLAALAARGAAGAVIVPLFLGPSESLRRALVACTEELVEASPIQGSLPSGCRQFDLRVGACLVDEGAPDDARVARALASHVLRVARRERLSQPLRVVLCDHGTPSRRVNAVRERLAAELRAVLGRRADSVTSASMERREGAAYDFNEPLLERCLAAPPCDAGDVILAMAFVLPGRHAGEGGDVARIVQSAQRHATRAPLRVHFTPPLASHSSVISVLADRVREAEAAEAPPFASE